MPVYRVNVKWQKQKFPDVECNTDESPEVFKAMLYSLTGVPPERQKVMMPGKILSGSTFDGFNIKDGITIMLLGTVDELPNIDTKMVKEEEIQKVDEQAVVLPYGLVNLGNTCYMNAAVQMLYSVPELRLSLKISGPSSTTLGYTSPDLCSNLRLLFNSLDSAKKPVVPALFLNSLLSTCPQFATRSSEAAAKANQPGGILSMMSGGLEQQDACECWIELIRCIQKVSIDSTMITKVPQLPESFRTPNPWNPVDRFFTGHMKCKLTCTESDEPETEIQETFTHLSCFMNQEVKYLMTGIRNGFEGTVTKRSPSLDRDAVYRRTSKVNRLPAYLCIQFVRFFYKEDKQINAKILKDVKFPMSLDMFEFCTPELQNKLVPMREKMRLQEEQEVQSLPKPDKNAHKSITKEPDPFTNPKLYEPYWLADDPGSNNSGYYELQGVLSHQGRTSASGHYVAWIKKEGMWLKFDDDNVSQVGPEDILRLSGGGDWHCAYILLYAPRYLKISSEPSATDNTVSTAQGANVSSTVGDSNGGDRMES